MQSRNFREMHTIGASSRAPIALIAVVNKLSVASSSFPHAFSLIPCIFDNTSRLIIYTTDRGASVSRARATRETHRFLTVFLTADTQIPNRGIYRRGPLLRTGFLCDFQLARTTRSAKLLREFHEARLSYGGCVRRICKRISRFCRARRSMRESYALQVRGRTEFEMSSGNFDGRWHFRRACFLDRRG